MIQLFLSAGEPGSDGVQALVLMAVLFGNSLHPRYSPRQPVSGTGCWVQLSYCTVCSSGNSENGGKCWYIF